MMCCVVRIVTVMIRGIYPRLIICTVSWYLAYLMQPLRVLDNPSKIGNFANRYQAGTNMYAIPVKLQMMLISSGIRGTSQGQDQYSSYDNVPVLHINTLFALVAATNRRW